jgi:hypothetical protein
LQRFGRWQSTAQTTLRHEHAEEDVDAASDEEAEPSATPEGEVAVPAGAAVEDPAIAAELGESLPPVISIRDWTNDEDEPAAADPSISLAAAAAKTRKLKQKVVGAMDATVAGSSSVCPTGRKKGRKMPIAQG